METDPGAVVTEGAEEQKMKRRAGRKKKKRYGRKWQTAGLYFVFPGFAGVLVFYLIPFLDVVKRSFMTALGNRFCGLANYRTVFANTAFRLAAGNTIRFLAVCMPLLLFLSFAAALGLREVFSQDGVRYALFKSAYLVPLSVPAASVVLLWRLVFDGHGFLNGVLTAMGYPGKDWMNTESAFYVLVFSYIWKNLGYVMVLWLAGLATVPETLYEAARVDGAGKKACFFCITLPCIRPVIFTIAVISLLNSFKVFREAWMVAGSYPQDSIYLLQHLFNNWFRDLAMEKIAAGAVVLAGMITFLIALMYRWGEYSRIPGRRDWREDT